MSDRLTVRLGGRLTAVGVMGGRSGAPADDGPAAAASPTLEDERACLHQARKALEDALVKLAELQQQQLCDAEDQLRDLAVEIARKVLMQEIQAGRYEIDPIVKEALLHVPARKNVVIHLNPDDLAKCEMVGQDDDSAKTGVRFVADPGIQRAECVLETSEGVIDCSIETHLEDVSEALKTAE